MPYYKKIDGLRCVAILLVILEHFAFGIGKYISAGYYGVDLFFVISGFLVTHILIKPTQISPIKQYARFIGKRTLRIFPIYYLVILILWLSNYSVIRQKLVWFLTYTYNYAWKHFELKNNSVSHFWSLAVEEQFYLLWPLLIIGLKKSTTKLMVAIVLLIVVGYSQMIFNIIPIFSKYNEVGLLTRMASLSLGGFVAIFSMKHTYSSAVMQKWWHNNILVESLFLALLSITLITSYAAKPIVLGLCSCFFILKATYGEFKILAIERFLTNKFIVYIGSISYGIYIYHLPINYYFTKYLFKPIILEWLYSTFTSIIPQIRYSIWLIKFPFLISFTLLAAHLSYKYLEKPILRYKDNLFNK